MFIHTSKGLRISFFSYLKKGENLYRFLNVLGYFSQTKNQPNVETYKAITMFKLLKIPNIYQKNYNTKTK